MDYHLSQRKRKDSIYLYACRDWTDPKTHKRKKEQHYLGVFKQGVCHFVEEALNFYEVLKGTIYEAQYWQWRKLRSVQATEEALYTEDDLVQAEDCNAGIALFCNEQVKKLGLNALLEKVFDKDLSKRILSLVYFIARGGRDPLYTAANWSRDQILPIQKNMTEDDIARTLSDITASKILTFMISWMKKFPRNERLSLDITSISSYSRQISDITWGYNRDHEKLPQINLLMIVSQESRSPVWIEQLPGAISDNTTLKDVFQVLKQADDTQRCFVFDRGFASTENIAALLKNKLKFTMGLPLGVWKSVLEEAKTLFQEKKFFSPDAVLDDLEYEGYPVHAVSVVRHIDGHIVYDHFYYTDRLQNKDKAELTKLLKLVQKKLKNQEDIVDPTEQIIADNCFTAKNTPKRGYTVKAKPEAIAIMREKTSGFFVIRTNQFKSPADAFKTYRLRDGIEKRFDDMKNQEDAKRLRIHTAHNMRSRIFLQFLSQILRCNALETMDKSELKIPRVKTVTDLYFLIESIRRIKIENHRPFYKRPTKAQLVALEMFGISTDTAQWPSLQTAV